MSAFNAGAVQVEIDYPERMSRLLVLVKWLFVIPQLIVLYFINIAAAVVILIAFFATIVLGRYPRDLFDFSVGVARWKLRVSGYQLLMCDRYPAFSTAEDPAYPVRLVVSYPERVARWRPLLTWLLVIPAAIVSFLVSLFALIATIPAWFAILILGRYPRPIFDLVAYALTLSVKTSLYQYWLVREYPFS